MPVSDRDVIRLIVFTLVRKLCTLEPAYDWGVETFVY